MDRLSKIRETELTERQRKLYETTVFLAKLLFAGAIFHLILILYPDTYPIQSFLAEITATGLRFTGVPAYSQGIDIYLESGVYRVTQDCLGWKSMAAFTGLMFASNKRLQNYYRFLLKGLAAIIAANLVRVITTVYLAQSKKVPFSIVHDLFWKWGLTVIVLLLWIHWLNGNSETHLYTKFENLI